MQTPMDRFVHELSDMLSAETIIIEMLAQGAQVVSNEQLGQVLEKHREESRVQARNVQKSFSLLGQQPHDVTYYAAQGLEQSLMEGVQGARSNDVVDAFATAGGCKTELSRSRATPACCRRRS